MVAANPDPARVAAYVRPTFNSLPCLAYRKRNRQVVGGKLDVVEIFVFRDLIVARNMATGQAAKSRSFIPGDEWLYPFPFIPHIDDPSLIRDNLHGFGDRHRE